MNPRRLRWITALAATGAIAGGTATLEHLPTPAAPAAASPAAPATASSTDRLQRSLAAQAARLQHQVAVETARLAAESAQLAQRRAALAQESAALQRAVAAHNLTAPSSVAAAAPVTHATTGASRASSDGTSGDN